MKYFEYGVYNKSIQTSNNICLYAVRYKIHAFLTQTLAYFLRGRAKDLSASL